MVCHQEPSFMLLKKSELDYIEADTPEQFLAALIRLRDDVNLYNKMVENGLARSRDFTEKKIADIWLATLRQITAWSSSRSKISQSNIGTLGRMLRYNSGHFLRRIVSGNREK